MRKYIVVSLALALAGGSVWAGGLDLLSRAELRRAREARLATPMRAPSPLAVKGDIRSEAGSRIGAFVRLNEGYTVDDLEADGITVLSCRGNIALCMVPVDSAEVLAEKSPVHTMQIARKTHTHMDLEVSGTVTADGFDSGTKAEISGGTT